MPEKKQRPRRCTRVRIKTCLTHYLSAWIPIKLIYLTQDCYPDFQCLELSAKSHSSQMTHRPRKTKICWGNTLESWSRENLSSLRETGTFNSKTLRGSTTKLTIQAVKTYLRVAVCRCKTLRHHHQSQLLRPLLPFKLYKELSHSFQAHLSYSSLSSRIWIRIRTRWSVARQLWVRSLPNNQFSPIRIFRHLWRAIFTICRCLEETIIYR